MLNFTAQDFTRNFNNAFEREAKCHMKYPNWITDNIQIAYEVMQEAESEYNYHSGLASLTALLVVSDLFDGNIK